MLGIAGEEAFSLFVLGLLARLRREPESARAYFDEGLVIARKGAHAAGEGMNYFGLAQLSALLGDYAEARTAAESALQCFTRAGWQRGLADVLAFLGDVAFQGGDDAAAQSLLEQSLTLESELGADWWSAATLVRLGQVALERGELEESRAWLCRGLVISQRLGAIDAMTLGLTGLAQLAVEHGAAVEALRLGGAAAQLSTGVSIRRQLRDLECFEGRMSAARSTLGDALAAAAWTQGQTLSWDAAIALALESTAATPSDVPAAMGVASR